MWFRAFVYIKSDHPDLRPDCQFPQWFRQLKPDAGHPTDWQSPWMMTARLYWRYPHLTPLERAMVHAIQTKRLHT
eukprot:4281646-Amphidinium_carterae.1